MNGKRRCLHIKKEAAALAGPTGLKIRHGRFLQFFKAVKHGILVKRRLAPQFLNDLKAFVLAAPVDHRIQRIRPVRGRSRAEIHVGNALVLGRHLAYGVAVGLVDDPRDHRVVRPAGLLVFDAGPETADGAVFLHAAQKVQHRLLIGPHFAGDVRIRGQGIGELELDNQQIVLDELEKDFIQKFVAFSYEDICKDIFASLCRNKEVDFVPSRIGSYWLNDINGDTEIDVMAVDHQKKQVFAGECKYHNKPVDATVYYELEEKVKKSAELRSAFPGYKVLYGLFSKSGFTQRMLDQAEGRDDILLIQEAHIL